MDYLELCLKRSSDLVSLESEFSHHLKNFLLYSLIPYVFFAIVVLSITGEGPFGIFSFNAPTNAILIYPFTLLLGQLIFGVALSWQYKGTSAFLGIPNAKNAIKQSGPRMRVAKSSDRLYSRRTFIEKGLITAVSLGVLALGLDGAISLLANQTTQTILPGSSYDLQNAPQIFDDPRLQSLVNSEVTSNGSFYKVTINLIDPNVDSSTWSLQVAGLVANPKSYSLSDLENNLPQVEQYSTFECVSNEINGNLISNAKWTGFKLSDLFNDVGGVLPSAQYVIVYSVDGYSAGIPIANAVMSDSILAYMMNDATLPTGHGFPLRAVFPGIYGMMSPKWIRKIEVVDSVYSGYWQTRGWTNVATIETLTFISVPSSSDSVSISKNNGSVLLGGVAFAGDRGISKVEVSVDGGKNWQAAMLKPRISELTWTLWAYDWQPTAPGNYNVYARAADGTGVTQTSQVTQPFPNGATGYVTIPVDVVS